MLPRLYAKRKYQMVLITRFNNEYKSRSFLLYLQYALVRRVINMTLVVLKAMTNE